MQRLRDDPAHHEIHLGRQSGEEHVGLRAPLDLEACRAEFGGPGPERIDGAVSILNALSTEASIMARCTGKTDVRNLEPEDLRAITLVTAEATGIPLAGMKRTKTSPQAAE